MINTVLEKALLYGIIEAIVPESHTGRKTYSFIWRRTMKELIKKMILASIDSWTDDDIYAISLFVYDDNDNPCKPTVTLGYNTERQVQEALNFGFAEEDEARWNYAFWLQNSAFVFGTDETAEAVKNWVSNNGFEYIDDDDAAYEKYQDGCEITQVFVNLLVEIVREIHEEKVLTGKFGKELPVLIHELEYYDEIAEQNIRANSEELVSEFAEWCRYC